MEGKGQGLDRADIERRAKAVEERGMVDLDAPLRDSIPQIAKTMARYRSSDRWWIIASGDDPHAVCECHF